MQAVCNWKMLTHASQNPVCTHTHCVAHPRGRFKYLCGWLCHNCSVIQVLFALLCKLGHLKENEQFDKSMMIRLRLIGTNYPRLSYFYFYFFQATRAKCTCQSKQNNTIKAFSVEACRSSRPCAMRAFSFKQTLTIRHWHHWTPVVWKKGKWNGFWKLFLVTHADKIYIFSTF